MGALRRDRELREHAEQGFRIVRMLDRIAQAQHTIEEACREVGSADHDHGGLRHAHGFHFPQRDSVDPAREGQAALGAGMSGVRDGPGLYRRRDAVGGPRRLPDRHLRRHDSRAGQRRLAGDAGVAGQRQGRPEQRGCAPVGPRESRTRRSCSSPSASRRRRRRRRWPSRKRRARGIENFCILSGHKLVIPAMRALLGGMNDRIDAFLCPGHVSVIIGSGAFAEIVRDYHRPCVVAGFEPLQIIEGLAEICRQLAAGTAEVKSIYGAVVTEKGNVAAQRIIDECFEPVGWLLARSRQDSEEHAGSQRAIQSIRCVPTIRHGGQARQGDQRLPVRRGPVRVDRAD